MQEWLMDFRDGEPPSNEEIIARLQDFGFYHPPHIVRRMYVEYVNNSAYWYAGAGADQPDEYWDDLGTMFTLDLYIEHVLPLAQYQSTISQEDVIERLRRGGTLNG